MRSLSTSSLTKARCACSHVYAMGTSPRILRANCISRRVMVTHFRWRQHKFESSMRFTTYASAASCNAEMVMLCIRRVGSIVLQISRQTRPKATLGMIMSVRLWYFLISASAFVPGRNRYGFRGFCRIDTWLPWLP